MIKYPHHQIRIPCESDERGKAETGILSKQALSFSLGLSCGFCSSQRSSTRIPSFASGLDTSLRCPKLSLLIIFISGIVAIFSGKSTVKKVPSLFSGNSKRSKNPLFLFSVRSFLKLAIVIFVLNYRLKYTP